MRQLTAELSRTVLGPFASTGRFVFRKFVVWGYRGWSGVRKTSSDLSAPLKRHPVYIFSNRWAPHVLILFLVVFVGVGSLRTSRVQAEGFGTHSLLFALVSNDLSPSAVEEVVATTSFDDLRPAEEYFGSELVVGSLGGFDYHSIGDPYVTTTVGGAVVAPVISEGAPSVSPRSEVETYVVVEGDTLGAISERFGLSLNTLLWANGLSFRSTLRLGQALTIPPVDGVIHTVKRGETVSSIAKKYQADPATIIVFNRLSSGNDLDVGEKLVVPGGRVIYSAPVRTVAPVGSLFATPPSASRALPAGSGKWVWPADLRYITQYFGWRHTGIDIDCNGHLSSTNSNYAAADGEVVYSGWRAGYGNTVEIDHGNGLKTRYGHNAKLYVTRGTVVTAGTPIALCGNTGRSTGTHLHFEVIGNGRFYNPLEYLR
ncbi:M23 family metallopeptidase [Candidatus Uhrbacteria bacterium]|nr:M23 family metallopeptidase [Candidatus Uhrbacteria bacterium]